ncbi:MAG: M55 family metallopeptidase [Anaerolineae bacterium]|jgi:D-amino peptidase|nr:M55 family metallopeptidase [Anaerolineae bacterium]
MKSVYIVTDLEGCAGVVSFADQSYPDGRYYDAAKKLATAEVNAAVEGLLEAGVEEILIWDGHGAGGIVFEELHPAARLLHGRPMPPWSRLEGVIRRYEAVVMIGQHAMAGTLTGNQNHTQNSRAIDYLKLNGRPIGETAQIALYFGALGLPLIFLSGDADACREAEELVAGISTVAVKEGLGRGAAISLSAVEARRRIRAEIKLAIERQRVRPIPPLIWPGPYILEKRFFHTDVADAAASQPGVERVDSQTVRLRGDDIREIIYR